MENQQHITIIIAEDDDIIRQTLEGYLLSFPQVELLTSLSDGNHIIEKVLALMPTAIFLDIMMPGINGLNLAFKLREIYPDINLVFVTGHTEYAATAFQLDAVDYLVKPITKESVSRALDRIRRRSKIQNITNSDDATSTIVVKNNHDLYFIQKDSILYLEKEQRKTTIHTENGQYITSEPISSLESKLHPDFFRCHKSFMINLKKIGKVYPIDERVYGVAFISYPKEAVMGRKAFKEFCSIMALKRLV
jgi:two-component system, LytTR family, response regulator